MGYILHAGSGKPRIFTGFWTVSTATHGTYRSDLDCNLNTGYELVWINASPDHDVAIHDADVGCVSDNK